MQQKKKENAGITVLLLFVCFYRNLWIFICHSLFNNAENREPIVSRVFFTSVPNSTRSSGKKSGKFSSEVVEEVLS